MNAPVAATAALERPVALSIEHVAVHFGGLVAISDLHFTVGEGELVSLIGPNGAGKTTAFNVITGFLRPTKGKVVYRGTPLTGLKPHEVTKLGLVRTFQRTSVFDSCTVFENVLMGLHRRVHIGLVATILALPSSARAEAELREQAWDILRLVGIEHRASELGGSLPYGEQRLLGVALALATNPSALLLDEPVSGMNPTETGNFVRLLAKIRERGTTILLVEHDMPMVMGISDRVVVLNNGRLIAEGPPSVVQNDPEVIRAYLGQGAKCA